MRVPPQIDGVLLDEVLGQGGMAVVFAGRLVDSGQEVAVKVVLPADRDATSVLRALQEGRLAWSIRHPNLVRAFDWGILEDGRAYVIMERLRGLDLGEALASGPLPPSRALAILRQAASGLVPVHDRRATHRDIKPSNLFLCTDRPEPDHVKVIDLGIAALPTHDPERVFQTGRGLLYGTPGFISPERLRGEVADARSDVFALGGTLFQAVSGAPPFGTGSSLAVSMRVLSATSPPALPTGIPDDIASLVRRCMAPDPAARPADAAAVVAAIDEIRETRTRARPPVTLRTAAATRHTGDLRLPLAGDELDRERFRRHVISAIASSFRPGHLPAIIRTTLADVDRVNDERARLTRERQRLEAAISAAHTACARLQAPAEEVLTACRRDVAHCIAEMDASRSALTTRERELADLDRAYLAGYHDLHARLDDESHRAADDGADLDLHQMLAGVTHHTITVLSTLVERRAALAEKCASARATVRAAAAALATARQALAAAEAARHAVAVEERARIQHLETELARVEDAALHADRTLECRFIALSLELARAGAPDRV